MEGYRNMTQISTRHNHMESFIMGITEKHGNMEIWTHLIIRYQELQY
jgi:hypothetical protein